MAAPGPGHSTRSLGSPDEQSMPDTATRTRNDNARALLPSIDAAHQEKNNDETKHDAC
jgi:hypothetical protein